MKSLFSLSLIMLFMIASCTQKGKETESTLKIENTLKSVSLMYDSIGIDPSLLFNMFEKANKAIDSIGYPDAGYKLWLLQGDEPKDFRFMLEGYWPNQAIYDTIHKNEIYLNAWNSIDEEVWNKLKRISYYRFILVK